MLSLKPWKPEAVLRLLFGIFGCVVLGNLLALLVRGAGGVKAEMSLGRMLLSVLCFHGVALGLVWRFLREHELGWAAAFGFRHRQSRALLLAPLAVLVFLPLGQGLQILSIKILTGLHLDPAAQAVVEVLRGADHGLGLVAFAVATIGLVPVAEELVFRGILYPAIKAAGFPQLALWGTALLFATIHFNLASFLPLLLLALVLTWLYEIADNLLAPIVAHSLFNAVNLGLFFLSEDFRRILPTPS